MSAKNKYGESLARKTLALLERWPHEQITSTQIALHGGARPEGSWIEWARCVGVTPSPDSRRGHGYTYRFQVADLRAALENYVRLPPGCVGASPPPPLDESRQRFDQALREFSSSIDMLYEEFGERFARQEEALAILFKHMGTLLKRQEVLLTAFDIASPTP